MSRPRAEMMPTVTVPPSPKGLPMAITQSPMRIRSDSPKRHLGQRLVRLDLEHRQIGLGSAPTSSALSFEPSAKLTSMSSAPSMT
jgi:hypothetical protein